MYTNEDEAPTTKARKAAQARKRRARSKEREVALSILKGMKPLQIQEAITRAYRSEVTLTKDGRIRRYRIGAHVAAMCRQLLFWEGKGEIYGGWVYKSESEWERSDAALTPSKLRTARRTAREEGLIKEKPGTRRDKRATVCYRLDVPRLAQVVVACELENTRGLLASEGRPEHKKSLRKKIQELEGAKADLALRDKPEVDTVAGSGEVHTYAQNEEVESDAQLG